MNSPNTELLFQIKDEIAAVRAQITGLDTKLTSLTGNGQPGRVGKLELEVQKHSEEINRWKGVCWLLGFVATSGAIGVIWQAFVK